MTIEELKSNAAAMTAFADGHPVEYKYHIHPDSYQWEELRGTPTWNFDQILYRPKPAPKTRPWSKPDEIPGPVCYIRRNRSIFPAYPGCSMIISANEYGLVYVARIGDDSNSAMLIRASWDELKDYEHSTDRKTWHPCDVTE